MNSAILLIPLFIIRYGLLGAVNKVALPRAAHFPQAQGIEKPMFLIYQLATVAIIVYMTFLKVNTQSPVFYTGVGVYITGVLIFAMATINFAKPSESGINQTGLYRFSRNPMYVAYFVYFVGCALLACSIPLAVMVCVFQIAGHWVILAEERWCEETFGDEYIQYMQKVRRYI